MNGRRAAEKERVEAERKAGEEPRPIGRGFFGNIYDQFKGKVKDAFDFLLNHKDGDLLGVFHREDIGDIDLVWGSRAENRGLDHIIDKHIERYHDFANVEEAMEIIDDVINNGQVNEKKSRWDKVVLEKDGYMVVVSKNLRDQNGNVVDNRKNWVVTAFDNNNKLKEKSSSDITRVTPNTDEGSRAVAPGEDSSADKSKGSVSEKQGNDGESAAEKSNADEIANGAENTKSPALTDANREDTTPISDLSETVSDDKGSGSSVPTQGTEGEKRPDEANAKEAANENGSADVSRGSAKEHKAEEPQPLTHNEVVLRDALAGMMRENGMEVIGDAEGQKVLDLANGKNVSKGIKLAIDSINKETGNSRQPMAEPSRQNG